jgi:hypothetical protein
MERVRRAERDLFLQDSGGNLFGDEKACTHAIGSIQVEATSKVVSTYVNTSRESL